MNRMRNFGFFLLSLLYIGCGADDEVINESIKKDSSIIPTAITEYGFVLDSFQVKRDTVKSNWTMSHMFAPYGISQLDINVAAEKAADSLIGLRYVKEGTPFIVLSALGDTSETAEYVIYPKNIVDFVVFDFRDSVSVEKRSKPNEVNEKMLSGEIIKNSNLTLALDQQLKDVNMTEEMAEYMSGVFAWAIDFFRLYPGDEFKVIYNEKSVEERPYAIGILWLGKIVDG